MASLVYPMFVLTQGLNHRAPNERDAIVAMTSETNFLTVLEQTCL